MSPLGVFLQVHRHLHLLPPSLAMARSPRHTLPCPGKYAHGNGQIGVGMKNKEARTERVEEEQCLDRSQANQTIKEKRVVFLKEKEKKKKTVPNLSLFCWALCVCFHFQSHFFFFFFLNIRSHQCHKKQRRALAQQTAQHSNLEAEDISR